MEARRNLYAAWKGSGQTWTSTSRKKTSPKPAAKCGATSRETFPDGGGARHTRGNLVSPSLERIISHGAASHSTRHWLRKTHICFRHLIRGDDLSCRERAVAS